MEGLGELRTIAGRMRALRTLVERTPLDYVQWLPMQMRFLEESAKRRLLRLGNQWGGKTFVGLANCIYHCLGDHPFYDVPPPPVTGVIVTASWAQSVAIQEKLWHLLPKDQLHPSTVYIDGHGFRGKNPCVKFRNGSKLWIKTTNQGGLSLAGGTYDFVHFDEPPKNARVYAEMVKRTTRTNGWVFLTFTPVNAPVDYIRDMAEDDEHRLVDIHSRCVPEMLIPVGNTRPIRIDGEVCDQDWIDAQIADSLAYEVEVVVHGGWEFRQEGRIFVAYQDDVNDGHTVKAAPPQFSGKFDLHFGADHGSGDNFSSCAVLVGVVKSEHGHAVWVLDEYVSDGMTTEKQDAKGVVDMLKRWGWVWKDIDHAFGDRVHYGPKGGLGKKSNGQLQRAVARELGVQPHKMGKQILTVKRGKGHGAGSVHMGVRWLHRAMVRGDFHVSERCTRVLGMLNNWDGSDDQWKHIADGLRYALNNVIFTRRARTSAAIKNG